MFVGHLSFVWLCFTIIFVGNKYIFADKYCKKQGVCFPVSYHLGMTLTWGEENAYKHKDNDLASQHHLHMALASGEDKWSAS
jgi:hypothetical protein